MEFERCWVSPYGDIEYDRPLLSMNSLRCGTVDRGAGNCRGRATLAHLINPDPAFDFRIETFERPENFNLDRPFLTRLTGGAARTPRIGGDPSSQSRTRLLRWCCAGNPNPNRDILHSSGRNSPTGQRAPSFLGATTLAPIDRLVHHGTIPGDERRELLPVRRA